MKPTTIELANGDDAAAYVASFAGQDAPRRVLFIENPGGPATMLARRIAPQLGPLADDELEQAAWVRFGAGICRTAEDCFRRQRPLRAPHHTLSYAAMFGSSGRPGELSLAHAGVLFLDEVHEFRRTVLADVLDGLPVDLRPYPRQPGPEPIPFTRIPSTPCVLVAATTPCPCGWLGHALRSCSCSAARVRAHVDRQERGRFHHVVRLVDRSKRFDPVDWAALQDLPV